METDLKDVKCSPCPDDVTHGQDVENTMTDQLPRFEIKKWNAVAMWSWNILTDTCAICRNTLNTPSINYQANPSPANEAGLQIAFGSCGHVFHLDCIQRWRKTRSVCPLCNKEWEDSKYERIPGFSNLGN